MGIAVAEWGGCAFAWSESGAPSRPGQTVWSIVADTSRSFAPGPAPFRINYRVADLHGLLALLPSERGSGEAKVDESEFGQFGWVMDPEGNRVELWEPPAAAPQSAVGG